MFVSPPRGRGRFPHPTPMNQLVKLLAVLAVAAMVLAAFNGALRPPSEAMSRIPEELPKRSSP